MRRIFIVCALALSLFSQAYAQTLSNQEVEIRAREVGRSLRCVVCQNQSIDESDADLAGDMRKLVREQIRGGKSNQDVLDFMQNRYGDYVLLKPPVQNNTYILWFAPFIILLSLLIWYAIVRRRRKPAIISEPLSGEEQQKLAALTAGTRMDEASK